MKLYLATSHAVLAAALLAAPGASFAQNQVDDQAAAVAREAAELQNAAARLDNTVANEAAEPEGDRRDGDGRDRDDDDDDDGGKWGLLGLLGLAGLAGLKRRDHDHHVRRDDRDFRDSSTTRSGTTRDTDTRP